MARRGGLRSRVTLRDDVEPGVAARIRMFRGLCVGEHVELGGCLAYRRAGPQPSGQHEPLREPVGQQLRPPRFDERGLGGEGEEVDGHHPAGSGEGLRRDSDDGHVRRPQAHDLSEDSRIPAEPRLPRVMRQHDDRSVAGPATFIGKERAAKLGPYLQNIEVVVADVLDPGPLRARPCIDSSGSARLCAARPSKTSLRSR